MTTPVAPASHPPPPADPSPAASRRARRRLYGCGSALAAFGIVVALVAWQLHRAVTYRYFEAKRDAYPADETWDTRPDLARFDGIPFAWPPVDRPFARGELRGGLKSRTYSELLAGGCTGTREAVLDRLWEENAPLRERLERAAAEAWGPSRRVPRTEARYRRPVTVRFAGLVDWPPLAVLLGVRALARGDAAFALKASSALLRHAHAVSLADGGSASLVGGLVRDSVVECADELFRRAALAAASHEGAAPEAVREALARRLLYLRDRVSPADMFAAEFQAREHMYRALYGRAPLLLGLLEFVYGSPVALDPFRVPGLAGKGGYAKTHADVKTAEESLRSVAGPSAGLSRWIAVHPLAAVAGPRIPAILADVATIDARFRLLTLAAMARLHRLEHGRWPDPGKDAAFAASAGLAAEDPMDGGPMRAKVFPEGDALLLYSVGIDGRDDGGDPGKDLSIEVSPPCAGEAAPGDRGGAPAQERKR